MCTLESTTTQNASGESYVVLRDAEMREVTRLEALSPEHARRMVADCAMLLARLNTAGLVLR